MWNFEALHNSLGINILLLEKQDRYSWDQVVFDTSFLSITMGSLSLKGVLYGLVTYEIGFKGKSG